MRTAYIRVLKTVIREKMVITRSAMKLTQAEMSEILVMDPRSYADLSSGKTMCGTLTFVLFLIYCCPDTSEFLNEIKQRLEEVRDNAA